MRTPTQRDRIRKVRSLLVVCMLVVLSGGLLVGCGSGSDRMTDSKTADDQRDVRAGTVNSIESADQDISSETVAGGMRVGVSLKDPRALYDGSEIASDPQNKEHQLRIVLREERTKRKLPGAEVRVQFLDGEGNERARARLLETWGDYYFYGKNINVPDEAVRMRVNVTPPLIGRHEDMKELYVEPVTTEFQFSRTNDGLSVQGTGPTPVSSGIRLGTDVVTAVEEALQMKNSGGYRIGFIAESAEPFWVFTRHEDSENSPRSLKMADFPQSANRHLEVVLFDQDSHRIVPHAGVTLDVAAREGNARAEVELPFLMSAFNHYGNSLYLPRFDYRVDAKITTPNLHTLEPDRFSEEATARFDWSPEE